MLPFLFIGFLALQKSGAALEEQAFNQLAAVQAIKAGEVEKFFAERRGDMGVLVETVATLRREAFNKLSAVQAIKKNQLEQYFQRAAINLSLIARNPTTVQAIAEFTDAFLAGGHKVGGTEWSAVEKRLGPVFTHLLKEDGYYDVFLISNAGDVVFSAVKEPDLGQNLVSGPLNNSGLGKAFRDSEKRKTAFADLAPYAPSNNQPAGFLASSIVDGAGKRVGAVAIQILINQINQIMQERTGLGKTGETYLVGPDKLMRSDSFLDPKNHTVEASFARPETGAVDTEASRAALAGKTGMDVISDYNGNPVLSVYGPVDTHGVRWARIAEIDVAEAFVPTDDTGGEFYKKYAKLYGYYDLFMINPNGFVFYTATREPDYQTNMVEGKFSASNLGRPCGMCCARKALASRISHPMPPPTTTPRRLHRPADRPSGRGRGDHCLADFP